MIYIYKGEHWRSVLLRRSAAAEARARLRDRCIHALSTPAAYAVAVATGIAISYAATQL